MNWRKQRNKTLRRFVEGKPIKETFKVSNEVPPDLMRSEIEYRLNAWYSIRKTLICVASIDTGTVWDDYAHDIYTVLITFHIRPLI